MAVDPSSRAGSAPKERRPFGKLRVGKNGGKDWYTGGAEGDRTPDLAIANDALSHLSYGPGPVRARAATRHGEPSELRALSEEVPRLKEQSSPASRLLRADRRVIGGD